MPISTALESSQRQPGLGCVAAWKGSKQHILEMHGASMLLESGIIFGVLSALCDLRRSCV